MRRKRSMFFRPLLRNFYLSRVARRLPVFGYAGTTCLLFAENRWWPASVQSALRRRTTGYRR